MKNLLNISDLNQSDFDEILKFANEIDINNENCLSGKNIGLIFEKNSTRTRLSFQVGIRQLKGNYIDIKLNELNLQRIETFEDTFEVMSCYLDCIIFRTTDHEKLKLAFNFFNKPIINALSNISHPCQAISDIFTLREHFKKKDNFEIVWLGDLNNILYSHIECLNFLKNSRIHIITDKKIYEKNKKFLQLSDQIKINFELDEKILKNADCIMTDVYNSMNDTEDKEPILKKFQVNQNLMNMTSDKTIFMHCLPAKIGSEVTKDVIKGEKSIVLQQAKNRMVAQRGILKWLNL